MEFVTDYRTERFALETKWDKLPEEVQTHARMCGIDLMTALILGSKGEQFKAGCRLADMLRLDGPIPVIGSDRRFDLFGATITMGHASNSFDIDDGHRGICGHPGASFVAGVLAAALSEDVNWTDYLTALTVCYELSIRWALAMQDHYGYLHSTGAYGAFGTAAGAGRLLGFTEQQLNNALSIADFHAPMTPVMRSVEYPSMNKDGVPFGAMTGMMAVLETLCGTTGAKHFLEMPEYQTHLDDLGVKWHILDLYFKPYTCCRWAHQPISACRDLMAEHGFSGRDVEHAKVHTFLSAARLSKAIPHRTDEAQYNIAWPVAAALVHGDVGYLQVTEAALSDQDVLAMMDRLEFTVDPDMDQAFPERRQAWVEITLKDGSCFRSRVYEAPGEPEDPDLDLSWITEKFCRITAPMLPPEDQSTLLALMTDKHSPAVRDIVAAINRSLLKNT